MVLTKLRPYFDPLFIPIARGLGKAVSPDQISWFAFFFALLASGSMMMTRWVPTYTIWMYLILFSVFVSINGYLDGLDGVLARITKRASKRGDFLDHVLDRYADVVLLLGIVLSPLCNDLLGTFAIVGMLLTSYMGTQAQAVRAGRVYGGLLGRAERLLILMLLPLVQIYFISNYPPYGHIDMFGFHFTILEVGILWIAIAGNFTAVQRAFRSWRYLSKRR